MVEQSFCWDRRESQSEENDNELTISTIPTAFENESQPLLGQGDVRKRTANDDEKESSGCFPVFPCLRRRWRKRGSVLLFLSVSICRTVSVCLSVHVNIHIFIYQSYYMNALKSYSYP